MSTSKDNFMDPYAHITDCRLSLNVSAKKIKRDTLSNLLLSESLHNLEMRSFLGKPLYKGKRNLLLN